MGLENATGQGQGLVQAEAGSSFAAKSRQVVEAAAAFITSRIMSSVDKENSLENSNVPNVVEVGVTPSKRKAEERRESVKRVGTVAVGFVPDEVENGAAKNAQKAQTVELQIPARPALQDKSNRAETNLSVLTREFSVLSFVAEPDEDEESENEKNETEVQRPGSSYQVQSQKMRRDTHFVIDLPPTPREDSAFPSPVSKNPPHRHLNPEYVYPTPSPTTINRSFFASPSEWYDIAGSEEDGEPSVKELEMLEQKDVLCLQEYAEEIHGYLRGLEGRSSNRRSYGDTQPFLSWQMRTDLIDWLIDICQHLRFNTETLHHTTTLIDHYLALCPLQILPKHFQLVGAACFLLASKAEEIEPPTLSWLAACSDGAFDRERLKHAEIQVLSTLGWNVGGFANVVHWLNRAGRAEFVGYTRELVCYIVELGIFEKRLVGERTSLVVAAAVWLARKIAGKTECWTPSLEYHLDQSPASIEFQHCVRILFDRIRKGSPSQSLLIRHHQTWVAAERWARSIPTAELERMIRLSAAKFSPEPESPSIIASNRISRVASRGPPATIRNFLSSNWN